MQTIFLAGIGAILGAVLRYAITNYGKKHWSTFLPYATLLINLSGALLLGVVYAKNLSPFIYALLGTGVLGGYTTFSTLNVELLKEWQSRRYVAFSLYFFLSYFVGLGLVFIGYWIGK
ncbi:fluoride efflux transporter CrcB [Lactobacillus sp. PV012]|uniref:fluoride efflux transporter CrcB n=1 Tax=Lactobacillus sp. PV012 TaxID=2594494 RepID=UPI00223FF6A3|nr:fluoride efflux transporter CrcB [Lactobacillus sp. PV012]